MTVKYPLAASTWDEEEYDALNRVIKSGNFSMGEEVRAYEREFADQFETRFAVMVNSGSSANLLMTASLFYTRNKSLKLEPGDEVIVPAISWSTTYNPLAQYGLRMKFVDVDAATLNYSMDALREAVTDDTRAIMVVNLLGNPNDFSEIQKIVSNRNIVIIEDNCESMGARFEGKNAGTFGVMGSFSSFFSHHISTMEGGMVVTDDEELYHIMLSLRAHGWTRDLPQENHVVGKKNDESFCESFRFVLPGYNLRPLEMSGALGREQIRKLPKLIQGRRDNGLEVQEKLSNHRLFMIQEEIGQSSWFGFSLVLRPDADMTRAEFISRLAEKGFECRPIVAGNFARSEVVQYFQHEIHGDLENADYVDARGLFIGNHHYPISEAIEVLKHL